MKDIREFWSIFAEDPKKTKGSIIEVGGMFLVLVAAFLSFIYLMA